jgi:hypothetical protein
MDMLDQLPDAARVRLFQTNCFNGLKRTEEAIQVLIPTDEHVVYHA